MFFTTSLKVKSDITVFSLHFSTIPPFHSFIHFPAAPASALYPAVPPALPHSLRVFCMRTAAPGISGGSAMAVKNILFIEYYKPRFIIRRHELSARFSANALGQHSSLRSPKFFLTRKKGCSVKKSNTFICICEYVQCVI